MSDEQAIAVIRLRHRLRTLAVLRQHGTAASEALEQFRDLSQSLGDPGLCIEHGRWATHFEQVVALSRC
jgi:hypothetical protein